MSISSVTEDAILNLIFSAVSWANYADNASSPETAIAVSAHTADPGDSGNMSTAEVVFSGYARVNTSRGNGWSASSGGSISPSDFIAFPVSAGAANGPITHFSTGKTGSGAQPILWSGTVTPPITIGQAGVTFRLSPASTITLD